MKEKEKEKKEKKKKNANAPNGAKRPPKELAAEIAVEEIRRRGEIFYPHSKYEEWDGDWEEN